MHLDYVRGSSDVLLEISRRTECNVLDCVSVELDLIGETVGWGIAPFPQLEKVRTSLIYEGYLDERKVMI